MLVYHRVNNMVIHDLDDWGYCTHFDLGHLILRWVDEVSACLHKGHLTSDRCPEHRERNAKIMTEHDCYPHFFRGFCHVGMGQYL